MSMSPIGHQSYVIKRHPLIVEASIDLEFQTLKPDMCVSSPPGDISALDPVRKKVQR